MLQVTAEQKNKFEEVMRDDNRKLAYRIKIDDKVVPLKQLKSQMVITTDGGFEEYHVGYALTSSLEFYTKKEFEMTSSSYVDIEVGLEVENGRNYEIVYLPFQRFYLYDSEIKGMERKVKCYDYMYKLASKGYFPSAQHRTTTAVCQDMSQQLGIEFKGVQNTTIYSDELEGRTYKEVLGYLASAMGCNVRIARDNKIEFFGLTMTHLTFKPREYKTPTTNESMYQITCLEVHYGEKKTGENGEVLDEGYYRVGEYTAKAGLLTLSNPLLKNQREVALRILNKLKELRYTRFETSISLADYRLEVGDMVSFQLEESKVTVPILYTQYTLVYDNVILSLKSPTKSQEKKEYSFQGTLTQKVNAVYTDLIQVKTLVAEKVSVEYLEAEFAKIEKLYVKEAEIERLIAGSISVKELQANIANINTLVAGKADITELNAAVANINILNADLGVIKNLVSGNLSSENIQAGGITSDKLTITNGFIKDAMIDSLNANKIKTGQINTALVRVTSSSGNLVINDNTIQIRDVNRVRVQIGKDAANDYSMSVWDSNGKLMFDARGLKADAIKDSIIRNDMISTNANIDGSKLNISSVVSSINQGSSLLKASKVQIDGVAQTLEVAFNVLKTQTDGTKSQTESNTTAINVAQGKINTLIQDTTITKNGQTTKLKDEYSKLEQTVGSLSSTIGKQQTTIDDHTGKITAFNSEMVSLRQNFDGLSARVSNAQTTLESQGHLIAQKANSADVYVKTEVYTKTQTDSAIKIARESIELGVKNTYETKTEVTNKINAIQVGSRNLVQQSPTLNNQFNQLNTYKGKRTIVDDSSAKSKKHVKFECTTAGTGFYLYLWNGDGSCVDKQYTWSFYAKMNKARRLSAIGHERGGRKDIDVTTEWQRFTHTWTYTAGSTVAFVFYPNFEVGDILYIRDLKIEEGNKATDWTPAPEDTELLVSNTKNEVKQYADSQITIAKNAITQTVASTYETKSDATFKINGVNSSISNLTTRVANAESKITEEAITNTIKKNFYTKEETNNQITSKGYATTLQLQQISDSVIAKFTASGGYNLIRNSGFLKEFNFWGTQTHNNPTGGNISSLGSTADWGFPNVKIRTAQIRLSNQSNMEYGLKCSVNTTVGRMYTIRFRYAAHRINQANVIVRNGGGGWHTNKYIDEPYRFSGGKGSESSWGTFTHSFRANNPSHILNFVITSAANDGYFWIAEPMVFEGEIDSPYSPHPDEVYSGQIALDESGIRVNASNVGSYTQMSADGFFVLKNDGHKLFEATNKVALYNGKGVSCVEIVNDPSANYGNARIDVRGGINFVHNPGQSTGTNQILLGNHDVSDQYGMHNMSIRAWNSLGFQDNLGLTNAFLDTRRGRWIMKGTVYQNTQTPPRAFSLNFDGDDEVYRSGFTRRQAVDSIMQLKTGVYVDNDGECCSAIYGGHDELITTEYTDEDGITSTHINTSALNASLVVTCQEQQKLIEALQKELNEIKKYLKVG